MKNQADKIKTFLLSNIPRHPKDIVAITSKQFDVSRMTVHRHLNTLITQNKIVKFGTTRKTTYSLINVFNKKLLFEIDSSLSESSVWEKYLKPALEKLPANIVGICEYGFTEMFNNAIDHSEGRVIIVNTKKKSNNLRIEISDNGIGIFRKLKNAFGFEDVREGVLALSKGKLTTDKKNHTGEGIFFTSRAFDVFVIKANGVSYIKNNIEDDWFVESRMDVDEEGTDVILEININSQRKTKDVFDEFTNPDTFAFNKTHVLVELCELKDERYISRSQAKRLLLGLEKFKHIILDFRHVMVVGQGFVDEVFRVYKNKHPDITIEYKNANSDVEFMIKRGIATTL